MRNFHLAFISLSFVLLACGEIKASNGPVDTPMEADVNLAVMQNGNGIGTVTSSPAGVNCGSDCIAAYASGTTVTLIATPDTGNTFAGWAGGDCSGTDSCVVTVTADTSIEAAFVKRQFTINVTPNGNGNGNVTSIPAGIDCGSACSAKFDVGTQVMLQLTPGAGSTFVGWTGTGCTGTGPCIVSINGDTTVQASFALNNSLVVTRTGSGTGTVTSSDGSISCGTNCSHQYSPNSMVTLTATAGAQSNFTGWMGGGCSGTGPCIVSVSAATAVTATFTLQTFTLTTTLSGNGGGVVKSIDNNINCGANCLFLYSYGTMVTLNATANTGSTFSGWSGNGCSETGACVVAIATATAVTATFTLNQYTLQVNKNGGGTGAVTSNVGGLNCGATCSTQINYNTVVTLTAAATNGSTFAGWSGGGCSGTGTCVQTMSANSTVTARFTCPGATFTYTGAVQTYVVPTCASQVYIEAYGAQGASGTGNSQGGLGGYAAGVLPVAPGQTITVVVGGRGARFNGGGSGSSSNTIVAHGGDASDIRFGGTSTSNRILVAGGGGGGGVGEGLWLGGAGGGGFCGANYCGGAGGRGWGGTGASGGSSGGAGITAFHSGGGGGGGVSSGGGGSCQNGFPPSSCGGNGSLAFGGFGDSSPKSLRPTCYTTYSGTAGGGGGYYGGGGSSVGNCGGGGGGGGSSYTGSLTAPVMLPGIQLGNGLVFITPY